MNLQNYWEKALKFTEIVRPRIQPLQTFDATHLSYIFLAESAVNLGDTVVRKGEVLVEKPAIILPQNLPQFEGFDSEEIPFSQDFVTNFFLVRGMKFPSMRYNNKTFSLDISEGKLREAIEQHKRDLEKAENISTGLVIGPEDCWQFSVIIFVCSQVLRSAEGDMKRLLEDLKRKGSPEI